MVSSAEEAELLLKSFGRVLRLVPMSTRHRVSANRDKDGLPPHRSHSSGSYDPAAHFLTNIPRRVGWAGSAGLSPLAFDAKLIPHERSASCNLAEISRRIRAPGISHIFLHRCPVIKPATGRRPFITPTDTPRGPTSNPFDQGGRGAVMCGAGAPSAIEISNTFSKTLFCRRLILLMTRVSSIRHSGICGDARLVVVRSRDRETRSHRIVGSRPAGVRSVTAWYATPGC